MLYLPILVDDLWLLLFPNLRAESLPKKEQLNPIELQVVLVIKSQPPSDSEAIEWWLVTTLPITSIEDVTTYIRWYSYPWLIERNHYVLKSGCGLEKLQLETAESLEMALSKSAHKNQTMLR